MNLSEVNASVQKNKRPERVGRGPGSGKGKTSARGMNGQGARAGFSMPPAFEGGQMPLARRIPKRGFNNKRFAEPVEAVTLAMLAANFEPSSDVTPDALRLKRLIEGARTYVKVIGNEEIAGAYHLKVHAISAQARGVVEKAGGTITILPRKKPVVKNKMRPKTKKV